MIWSSSELLLSVSLSICLSVRVRIRGLSVVADSFRLSRLFFSGWLPGRDGCAEEAAELGES